MADEIESISHVFISYSHQDSEYAHRLPECFEKFGFKTWLDEDIEYGERWFKDITQAIADCAAFVVVMTPGAEASDWVEKEILIALRKEKPIFGLLLRGETFPLLINKQSIVLKKEWQYLPPPGFFQQLAKVAPRVSREVKKPNYPKIQLTTEYIISTEVAQWIEFEIPNNNNFYGIAMLALAYERDGQRQRAVFHFKRAAMLEPRVKYKKFMTEHFGWTEEHHALVTRILMDANFKT